MLHLNDNDGHRDRHWLPQDPRGSVNWDLVVECIAGSPYTKPLQLEVNPPPNSNVPDSGYLKEAQTAVAVLNRQVAQARKNSPSAAV